MFSPSRQIILARALLALLSVVALLVISITLYVLVTSHWHGPFRDMWEIYPFLQKIVDHSWTWADLWESYGYSHRLVIPRLLYIADYQWSDANNHLLITVSVLAQVLVCLLFARVIFGDSSLSRLQKSCFLLLVIAFQSSGTLLFNLMHTFDVQWFLCVLFVTVAAACLAGVHLFPAATRSGTILTLAAIFIMLACLNNFSGMAMWPIWLFVALRMPVNNRLKLFLSGMIGLFVDVYAHGVHSEMLSQGSSADTATLLGYLFVYFPSFYLSNPLTSHHYLSLGIFGAALVIPPVVVLLLYWKRWSGSIDISPLQNFLAILGLFALGVAVMTAMGRGYDPSHVRAMRYQNIVLLFWSAMVPLVMLESATYTTTMRHAVRMCVVAVCIGFGLCQPLAWNENLSLGRNVAKSHLALMMGFSGNIPMIAATVSRSMIYVPGYTLEKERVLHERYGKGIYADGLARLWTNGVKLDDVTALCGSIDWSTSMLASDDQAAVSIFTVRSNEPLAGRGVALLVDASGHVIAMAIPEKPDDLATAFSFLTGRIVPPFKGWFRAGDAAEPFALVMMPASGVPAGGCKRLLR